MSERSKCDPDEVDFDFMQWDEFREEARSLLERFANVPLESKLTQIALLAKELKKG